MFREKEKKMRKRNLAVALAVTMIGATASGCGVNMPGGDGEKETPSVEATADTDNSETKEEVTEENTENQEETGTENLSGNESQEISINGDYFVKVGDKVYYREYPQNALESSALYGDFLMHPTGKESSVMCYDTTTKTSTTLFKDKGNGKIAYMDGRLYMTDKNGRFYSCDMDGSDVKELYPESHDVEAVDKKTKSVITSYYDENYSRMIFIWQDGEAVDTISDDDISFAFAYDGFVFYTKGELGKAELVGYDIEDQITYNYGKLQRGQNGLFGEPCMEDGKIYFSWGWTDGSAGEIQEIIIYSLTPDQDEKMKKEKKFSFDDNHGVLPAVSVENGKVSFQDYEDGHADINENGDLQMYSGGSYKTVKSKFTKNTDWECLVDEIEEQVTVDGTTYMIINTMKHDEKNDIGWRYAYKRIGTKIMALDAGGNVTEMK